MPPTISLTVGSAAEPLLPLVAAVEAPLQPARVSDSAAPAAATAAMLRFFMVWFLSWRRGIRRSGAGRNKGRRSDRLRLGADGWPPLEEGPLEEGDEVLGAERDDRHDDHAGEDRVRVEVALRLADDQADAVLGAEHLRDEGADDREAERGVQARDDPGHRRRDGHVPGDLQRRGPEDADVRDQVLVDLPHALEGVEEDGEEHEHGGEQDLREDPEPEGDDEDRAEHDPRDGVQHLDVGAEHVREVAVRTERDADDDPDDRAEREALEGLLDGDAEVLPDAAEGGALREEPNEAVPDAGGLPVEELVDPAECSDELPAADHEDGDEHASHPDPVAPPGAGTPPFGLHVDLPLGAERRCRGDHAATADCWYARVTSSFSDSQIRPCSSWKCCSW